MVAVARGHIIGEPRLRIGIAIGATLIGTSTIITRETAALDWSLVVPTVAAFWLWAFFQGQWILAVYSLGLFVPMVLNLVESEDEVSMFFLILTVAIMASMNDRRDVVLVAGIGIIALYGVLVATHALKDFGWENWLFGTLFSWGFGEIVYRYSQIVDELERTRSMVADQAAAHERRRIARDVHDLVGHSLSVVMLHITGARHVLRRDPDEAERALEQAEAAGRESLAEIRRTVGLLRDDRDPNDAAVPAPELNDVHALITDFDNAGLTISLHVDGPVDTVVGPAGLAGYRIIQEALTNAARHAPGAEVDVSISVAGSSYDLRVRNRGGQPTKPITNTEVSGSGFGLVSMRERARSLGGSLIAVPAKDGWLVEATLPFVQPVAPT